MNRVGFLILGLFIISDSCIDPLTYHISDGQHLVVDGMITDQPGPYTVLLYYAIKTGDEIYQTEKVKGCSVLIEVDNGETEKLHEVADGVYQTTSIQGELGRTYTLKFTTPSGDSYESTPEFMLPVGDLVRVYNEFVKVENPVHTDYINTRNGFNLYADALVASDEKHHIRWRRHGVYEVYTYADQGTAIGYDGREGPPACSKITNCNTCSKVGNCGGCCTCCTCCTCWVTQIDNNVYLSNEKLSGSDSLLRKFVGFVPASRRLLHKKFKIDIDQLSLSDNAYDYWLRVQTQTNGGSDLFQVPPALTGGNIINVSENLPEVFGYFGASAVKTKTITIKHWDVPYYLPDIDTIAESCLTHFLRSTNVRPPDWD